MIQTHNRQQYSPPYAEALQGTGGDVYYHTSFTTVTVNGLLHTVVT